MRINEETGEILELESVPYKNTEDYKEPYDKSKVMCKADVVDYFKDEIHNKTIKVRWTNWAMDELFKLDSGIAQKFNMLADLIIARNIVFETTENLQTALQLSPSRFKSVMKQMKDGGLIKEFKGHQGGRKWRYLELNPTLVFKTYQGRSDEIHYGSTSRFNGTHQFYIDKWVNAYIL